MTDLVEISLPIATADPQASIVRAVTDLFEAHVPGGAVVEVSGFGPYGEETGQVQVRGYLEDTPEHLSRLANLRSALLALPERERLGEPGLRTLAQRDWAEAWKQHYHPLRLGRLVIAPTWSTPASGPEEEVVWLDPGMAFGTGTHPSTQLILRLLQRFLRLQDRVLDVGTGSGILAIAAVRLGAGHVHATDIDAASVEIAAENARLNKVEDSITLEAGSVPGEGQYDVVCANILADVLADLLLNHDLRQRLRPKGTLLLSGIITPRRHVIDLALAACGLHIVAGEREGDWQALAARRMS